MLLTLSYDFSIDTELIKLRFLRGRQSGKAFIQQKDDTFSITLPVGFDFSNPKDHEWGKHLLTVALRHRAKQVLPKLLKGYAEEFGYTYNRLCIKDVHTRWGSCSALRNINLSLWLMLAPRHLVSYVIKHELAHLKEFNHGPRFWAEVDRMTEGKGKALEHEMKMFEKEKRFQLRNQYRRKINSK